jgi:hypothetical protein
MTLDPQLLLTHWPFAFATILFYTIGQTLKLGPFSAERAAQVPWVRFIRRWFPLPLHPIAAGALLGLIPSLPVSGGITGVGAHVFYFAGAGLASVLGRNVYSEWQKHGAAGAVAAVAAGVDKEDVDSVRPQGKN